MSHKQGAVILQWTKAIVWILVHTIETKDVSDDYQIIWQMYCDSNTIKWMLTSGGGRVQTFRQQEIKSEKWPPNPTLTLVSAVVHPKLSQFL